MHSNSSLSRLIHQVPPRMWLTIAGASLLLAAGSAMVLVSHLGEDQKGRLVLPFDAMGRFMRDTIRLTFKTDNNDSVFVAPRHLLEKSTSFKWVDEYQDFTPRPEDSPPEPIAPARLLDPDWNPVFSVAK